MPQYDVTDPQSGKTMTLEGDSPPTEQELNQVFDRVNGSAQVGPSPFVQGTGNLLRAFGGGAGQDFMGALDATVGKAGQNVGNSIRQAMGQQPNPEQPNAFLTPDQLSNMQAHPFQTIGKDVAGLTSWMIPMGPGSGIATKAPVIGGTLSKLPGVLPAVANLAASGATSAGLNQIAQPNSDLGSVAKSAEIGAVANPFIYGAGKLLTDTLPRAIGMRAYGPAGRSLPEVTKAEDAAGGQSLKEVRNAILDENKGTVNSDDLRGMIRDLADEDQWTGTPGILDKAKVGKRITETGAVPDIEKALRSSDNLFDFYSKVKNMAYASIPGEFDKTDQFMVSAAGKIREYMIQHSDSPELVRNAMDMYAAQTAMNSGEPIATSALGRSLNKVTGGLGGEGALSALSYLIPQTRIASLPLLLDAILSNPHIGGPIAKGLVRTGQKVGETAIPNILQHLGVAGLSNAATPPAPTQESY